MGSNKKGRRYIDEDGRIRDKHGNLQNMLDFLATEPFVPRYYDFKTTNKSFINMHVFLKRMGVKNNKEHLQIFNPALIGVDPFSDALPDTVKADILKEIKINPWYYFREIVRIPAVGKPVRFRLGLEGFSTIFFLTRRQNTLLTAPRQVGKTISVYAFGTWLLNIAGNGLKMGNMHYKAERAMANLKTMEGIMDSLPNYLQFHKKSVGKPDKDGSVLVKDKGKSASKKMSLKCEIFNNEIENFIVGQDPASANTVGRGATIPIWLIDELAHIKYNQIAVTSFSPAYSEAKNSARRFGKPFGIWSICTPGDLKTDEGKWTWDEINNEYMKFSYQHFKCFDMEEEDLEIYIKQYSRKGTVFISFQAEELGYSQNWISEKAKTLNIDGIRSEVLLKWETRTTDSPFPPYIISQLESLASDRDKYSKTEVLDDVGNEIVYYPRNHHVYTDSFKSFLQNFWEHGIIIGMDVAFGVGGNGDSSTMVALDAKTLEVVFTYSSNSVIVDDLALLIIRLIDEFFIANDIKVAFSIERNSNGRSLIGILKKYRDYSKFFIVYPASEYKIKNAIPSDFTFNYKGNQNMSFDMGLDVSKNRTELINLLMQVVHKYTECIAVREVVEEIKNLVIKKTASGDTRIEHADGKHDDLIFGLIQALYAIFRNSDLIKKRNRIEINPENFSINKNTTSINTTGVLNKRLIVTHKIINGKVVAEYYDKYQGIVVDKETALKLQEEDLNQSIISDEEKNKMIVDKLNNYEDQIVMEKLSDSGASDNISVKTVNDTTGNTYMNNAEYDNWIMSLFK